MAMQFIRRGTGPLTRAAAGWRTCPGRVGEPPPGGLENPPHEINSIGVKAVILLSGGLDSATVLAIARSAQRECHALSIVYGQRHEVEMSAAMRVAQTMGVAEHVVEKLDLRIFGASALTADIDVPKDSVDAPGIPITYVPARNTIF